MGKKAMGWCTAPCKMTLIHVKTIMREYAKLSEEERRKHTAHIANSHNALYNTKSLLLVIKTLRLTNPSLLSFWEISYSVRPCYIPTYKDISLQITTYSLSVQDSQVPPSYILQNMPCSSIGIWYVTGEDTCCGTLRVVVDTYHSWMWTSFLV